MNPKEKIPQLLERLSRLMANAYHEDGFKPVQWEALHYLSRANIFSRNPGSLGEYLGVTKGSVSQTISTLEQRGLLRKKSDSADKRVVRLELTAAGRRLVSVSPLASLSDAVETLKLAQQKDLASTLEALLITHLDARERKPFGQCRDCRHLLQESSQFRCGLLDVQLNTISTEQICAEFEPAAVGSR